MRSRRVLTTLALAGAASLVLASPAAAHPFFRDADQVPANSLTTLTLAMAHGCGDEAAGGGDPTLEIAVEVPESFSYVEPLDEEDEGYEASVETDAEGQPVALVWTATGDGVPAPDVELDVVVDGAPGDEVYVSVFQACADFEYRWIGTPDEPAEDPAVRLVLTDEDPESPPPVVEEEPEPEPEEDPTEEPADPTDDPADPAEDPVDEPDAPETGDPADDAAELDDAEDAAEEGGFPWIPLAVVLVVVVVLGGVLAARTRAKAAGPEGPGDGPGTPPAS